VSYKLLFHPQVAVDVAGFPATIRERIRNAIKERLITEPALYGKPLRATLKGYWKLRVGDYRVVYEIRGQEVIVFAVCHRRHVYGLVHKRLD
jgi:mRNA interferase RelE/StbE